MVGPEVCPFGQTTHQLFMTSIAENNSNDYNNMREIIEMNIINQFNSLVE